MQILGVSSHLINLFTWFWTLFTCSLFHGAIKSILTNKQLRGQNHSKYIILSYCSLNSVSTSWPFTHRKDCMSSVKPICCFAVCTPVWGATWWREFKSSTLPEHFIMGSSGAPFPPATNCQVELIFHQQRAQQNRRPSKLVVEEAYWKPSFLLFADGGLYYTEFFPILCLGSFRKTQSIGLSCFPWETIPQPNG